MVLNSVVESQNSNASCEITAKKSISKSSKGRSPNDAEVPKIDASDSVKLRVRSKTSDGTELRERRKCLSTRPASADYSLERGLLNIKLEKSETSVDKSGTETVGEEERCQNEILASNDKKEKLVENSSSISALRKAQTEAPKKVLIYDNPSETYSKLYREHVSISSEKSSGSDTSSKKSARNSKKYFKNQIKGSMTPSKLPIKVNLKEPEIEQIQRADSDSMENAKPNVVKTNPVKVKKDKKDGKDLKDGKEGKETKQAKESKDAKEAKDGKDGKDWKDVKDTKEIKDEKIRNALKENFSSLVPLYESELKKIIDTWVNTIYCSLMMRANLARLLFKALPTMNKSQFYTEDETLLKCVARAKTYTRAEAENLIQFIKLIMVNRNKAKDDYIIMTSNRQIAESYNHNWKSLMKKIVHLGEDIKQLQTDIPELDKKKESYEAAADEKIKKIELNLKKKDIEIQKLCNQLNMLKNREKSYMNNISVKPEAYQDIKEEVVSLKSVEKEFEELKAKYISQNDIFEKRIKDLEILLDEKKRTLLKERELKKQMHTFLIHLQSQEKYLCRKIGKEQVDFVLGRSPHGRNKRKEQLWVLAVKLVLRGFLVQMKRLERDRNKMLLDLNSNDMVNYNALATAIIQKDNFMKTIKDQMMAFHTATKYVTTKNSESSF